MDNKTFFKKTKNGFYDVNVILYDKDLKPFYGCYYTTSNPHPSIRGTITSAVNRYKYDSGYDMRKDGDNSKHEPKYAYIFTAPAFNCGIFTLNGRNVSETIDINSIDKDYPIWM